MIMLAVTTRDKYMKQTTSAWKKPDNFDTPMKQQKKKIGLTNGVVSAMRIRY